MQRQKAKAEGTLVPEVLNLISPTAEHSLYQRPQRLLGSQGIVGIGKRLRSAGLREEDAN